MEMPGKIIEKDRIAGEATKGDPTAGEEDEGEDLSTIPVRIVTILNRPPTTD